MAASQQNEPRRSIQRRSWLVHGVLHRSSSSSPRLACLTRTRSPLASWSTSAWSTWTRRALSSIYCSRTADSSMSSRPKAPAFALSPFFPSSLSRLATTK
ncbi:hypothetical protein BCR35DRAFT_99170 [Leucosporidium creatinivorum]|uniref:Uncharacterized protein n=1 Tax=Leucosporidium creatinivorum TaxID=106004 RepID=A0A1Y2F4Q8_9BASI|nr:hypothetical protein BCR35DRAFT_99170 [Leucosporidium creatinivorum]